MSGLGRSDPWPCGSGKKHKRWCLGKAAPAPGAWTVGERDSALASLMRFARRAELDEDRAAAEVTFWGKRLERMTPAEARETMDFEQSRFGFHEWLVFDCPLHGGGTIVERFLSRAGGGLRSGERRYLERMRLSHLRPYEVQAVRRDEGLDLLDLWANKRVRVRERLATRQLVQWDILAARVILGPEGYPVLDGSPYLYPPRGKELILRFLRLGRSLRGKLPRADETTFFKSIGMAFHDLWLELAARRPPPTLVTAERDEVVLCRAVFDVHDRAALEAALANHPELEREAANLESARPKVFALLKDMENLSARDRLEGRPAYDFGWMWGQLGLERSG